jgi:serine/threonine protein kinase
MLCCYCYCYYCNCTIQPENILCGEKIGDIKIADFGLSKLVLPDEIMKMPCGTLSYVAPEVRHSTNSNTHSVRIIAGSVSTTLRVQLQLMLSIVALVVQLVQQLLAVQCCVLATAVSVSLLRPRKQLY